MKILTQGDTAKLFNVEVKTVRDMTRIHGIETVAVPYNGNGVGYTPDAIKRLEKILTPKPLRKSRSPKSSRQAQTV